MESWGDPAIFRRPGRKEFVIKRMFNGPLRQWTSHPDSLRTVRHSDCSRTQDDGDDYVPGGKLFGPVSFQKKKNYKSENAD